MVPEKSAIVFDANQLPALSPVKIKNEESLFFGRGLEELNGLAHENHKATIKREEATIPQLSAADEAKKAISERFRLGVSDFVDLAQANQQLVQAQSYHA